MLNNITKTINPHQMSILSDFTSEELEEVIRENSSLRGYLQGYLAEVSLKKQLLAVPGVTSVTKIPDQGKEKGDFRVEYKGKTLTIEVKSIATNSVREDILNDTWQGTVQVKATDKRTIQVDGFGSVTSTSLLKGEFDVLAISCYAVSGKWEFLFIENEYLPEASTAPGLIKTSFTVNPATTPLLVNSVESVMDSVIQKQ
jgi:hypothetical protein